MPKNSVQVQQELRQLKTGEEIKFCEALEGRKIINSSLDELKNVLKFCMIKIGLRSASFPAEEEKAVLIDHVIKEFGGHTCQEIKLAFEMAIAGKLTECNSKNEMVTIDANCYENFSCLYFSKIMNAYRIWAEDVYKFVSRVKDQTVLQVENNRKLTDDDFEKWIEETRQIATDESKIPLMPLDIYDWLMDKKKLRITKDKRNEYLKQAVVLRHKELIELSNNGWNDSMEALEKFDKMKQAGVFEGYESNRVRDLAKKISVYNYILTK